MITYEFWKDDSNFDGEILKRLYEWGRNDQVNPFPLSAGLVRDLPGAALWMPERCGHSPQFELADDFNERLEKFLL